MAMYHDRLGEILDKHKRNRRPLITPEGLPLEIQAASHGERLVAFLLDMLLMGAVIVGLYILLIQLLFSRYNTSVGLTLVLFLAFLVRNLYFLHFELAWQGRTPGKKMCGLRVINRNGGELTPSALVARNLTREVEIFLPLSMLLMLGVGGDWESLAMLGWAAALTVVPLFNRDHLRAGDIIGGTQVIAMPKTLLLQDMASSEVSVNQSGQSYMFSPTQLAIYGAFELQVLEEFLRRPPTPETSHLLQETCERICRKIGWQDYVPERDVRRFLSDFYRAERANLERGRVFGEIREDKYAPSSSKFTHLIPAAPEPPRYTFSPTQLGRYGEQEYAVLGEFLHLSSGPESDRLLAEACLKIRKKIGWIDPIADKDVRRFLSDFYEAGRSKK